MATTIRQLESAPAKYPGITAAIPNASAAWQRIESYISYRYSQRDVRWTIEGPGEWFPPLRPFTISDPSNIGVWCHRAHAWENFVPNPTPLGGFYFPHSGPFYVLATVGCVDYLSPPEGVILAVRRLADYLSAHPGKAGATSESIEIGGTLTKSIRRDANFMAMALQNSGAADLLRAYRKVI